MTPEIKEIVWSALDNLASAPEDERTLTGLTLLLQSNALRSALTPYTLDGPYGRLLDAAEPDVADVAFADVQCFETEALLGQSGAVAPVLTYLFHRLEARFDGRPTLLILDEAWIFLDHPLFAARIREWLKTLRKKNVAVLFATQSLADVADSAIAPAIIESCPQRILLPNDRAIEPQGRAAYARFGLNDRQIELISRATPKRHYYLQSARGNRLFELGLGPIALALCGASDPASQLRMDRLLAEHGASDFGARFLDRCRSRLGRAAARRLSLILPRRLALSFLTLVMEMYRDTVASFSLRLMPVLLAAAAMTLVSPAHAHNGPCSTRAISRRIC